MTVTWSAQEKRGMWQVVMVTVYIISMIAVKPTGKRVGKLISPNHHTDYSIRESVFNGTVVCECMKNRGMALNLEPGQGTEKT